MSEQILADEIALRIGLAARELPDTDAARLLKVLADAVGLPPTADSLATLTVKKLKLAADGELSEIDANSLKSALAYLKGEGLEQTETLPEVQGYNEGDMPDSIRVAIASNKDELVDGHFGSCRRFLIYQVSKNELRLVDMRATTGPDARDDKNAFRAELINDCQVLYVASIGGPAAAKVVKNAIHPIKYPHGGTARDVLVDLQKILDGSPPPWLAKIMGHAPEQRVRFEVESEI